MLRNKVDKADSVRKISFLAQKTPRKRLLRRISLINTLMNNSNHMKRKRVTFQQIYSLVAQALNSVVNLHATETINSCLLYNLHIFIKQRL